MSVASLARPATAEEINPRRWWVLAVMSLTTFMVFLDNTIVNTALPSISRDLGASTATLQWVIDGYTLVLAGLLLVGGTMGDRFGRRRFLTLGMLIFGLAAAGAALSTNSTALIGFRGLQGVGAALVLPATLSIITANFPRDERAMAIGIWTATGGLAVGVGPVVGGLIVDEINWAAVFWLHIPVVVIALAGMRWVPESRDSRVLPLDISGALLATGGLFALVFGIIQGSEAGWTSPRIIAAFTAAAVLLGAFAVVEARSRAPMLPLHFFKQRDFNGAVIIIGLVFFSLMVTFFFLTQFFQIVQGKSAFTAGAYILPAAGMMLVGAPISAELSKRYGPRLLITMASVAVVGGLLWLSTLDAESSYLTIGVGLAAFGFGGGMALAPLTDTVMAAVPVNDAGVGSAVNDVSRELGAALGIAITGSIVSGIYRGNVNDSLGGTVPPELVDTVAEGIGVANVVAAALPADIAATVVEAANTAFIDAFTTGLLVSAGFMVLATIVGLVMIPNRMRQAQAQEQVQEQAQRLAPRQPQPIPEVAVQFDRPTVPGAVAVEAVLVEESGEAA